jgi:acyl-CoA thioesterase FadM
MHAHSAVSELLAGFPVVMVQPVLWGEQDPFGHVNHVTYFRWSETARISYFLNSGKPHPVPDHIRRDIERIEGRTF